MAWLMNLITARTITGRRAALVRIPNWRCLAGNNPTLAEKLANNANEVKN